jgi:hypothetical protein
VFQPDSIVRFLFVSKEVFVILRTLRPKPSKNARFIFLRESVEDSNYIIGNRGAAL